MAENERKSQLIGANYAWNIHLTVLFNRDWSNLLPSIFLQWITLSTNDVTFGNKFSSSLKMFIVKGNKIQLGFDNKYPENNQRLLRQR